MRTTANGTRLRAIPAVLGFVAAVCAILIFGWIATEVLRGQTHAFDDAVRGFVHSWASPWLTRVMEAFTFIGSAPTLMTVVAVLALVLWRMRQRRHAILLVLGTAGGNILMEVLKHAFRRPRPVPFFGLPTPDSWSFPSGHALNSFCVYVLAAALISRRMRSEASRVACWCFAVIMAVMPGISRIYLGVHYPSDVLAGYVAATAWLCGLLAALTRRSRDELRAGENACSTSDQEQ